MDAEHLKTDQEYNNRFDRTTIETMKSTIILVKEKLGENFQESVLYPFFIHKKFLIWKDKKATIENWKARDRELDNLVRRSVPHDEVKCLICSRPMKVVGNFLKHDNSKVVFLYDCQQDHKSRRAFYTDGVEYITKKKQCPECQSEIRVETIKKSTSLTFVEECVNCDYRFEDVMEWKEEKSISEKDRQRYCIMSEEEIKVAENFEQDLKNLLEVSSSLESKGLLKKEDYNIDKIEMLKLPSIEKRLVKCIVKKGFTKFSFGSPKLGSHFIVEFSVQDESDRQSRESAKLLRKEINDCLFYTNWRLISDSLNDRLGFITGRIKGYETDEDILKLGKEITKQINKSK